MSARAQDSQTNVVVVGGGLAGLIAATKLAQAGCSVVLLEQSKHFGGRAATNSISGVQFNLGPRALYRHGHAFRLLTELEVPFTGRYPQPGVALGYYGGREYRLPATFTDLLLTDLLSLRDKWRFASLLRDLSQLDTAALLKTSVRQWVTERYGAGPLANLLFGFFRVTSYSADMEHYSAGAALDQLKLALTGNVWYIDHGWQSLVDSLREVAAKLGVAFHSTAHVSAVKPVGTGLEFRLGNNGVMFADAAVLAVDPQKICSMLELLQDHQLAQWQQTARPIHAACLDIALTKLSRPRHRFALGLDRPYYLSVHSAAAKLGPEGVAVMHVMKYLDQSEPAERVEQELEQLLDRVQPGWQKHVLTRRYLPSMLVAHDLPQAASGGLADRPPVDIAGMPGVFVAGDWVGNRGQLADASAASAEEAAQRAIQFTQANRAHRLQYA